MKKRAAAIGVAATYAAVCAIAIAAYIVLFAINARYGLTLMPFYGVGLYIEIGLLLLSALAIAYFVYAASEAESRLRTVVAICAFFGAAIGIAFSLVFISCSFGDCF